MPPPGADPPQDVIVATARRTLLLDGVHSRLMDTMTGGVFLAGLAVFLGANNFTLGLLAALPALAQVAQLGNVKLLLMVHNRKAIVVWACLLGRSLLLVLALLVFLYGSALGAGPLVVLVTFMGVFAVVSAGAWNWWIRDLIPRDELGRYFGRRLQVMSILAAFGLVGAGVLLDALVERGYPAEGYALLFAAGGAFGLVSVYYLARTPHVAPAAVARTDRVLPLLWNVLRQAPNQRLLVALTLVSCTLTVALPFTAVYLLRGVGFGILEVTTLSLVSLLAYVGSLRAWGILSDRFGNRPVLQISMGILVVALLGWSAAGGERTAALFGGLLALHFLSGFAVAGIDLTSANVILKTAPLAEAPAYLAAMSLVRALAAGVATLAAGAAWQATGSGDVWVFQAGTFAWTLRGFHVLALASVALGFLAMLALPRIHEEGGAPIFEVARAMRREVRMLSSVTGIRAFVHVVSYVVEFLAPKHEPEAAPAPATAEAAPPEAAKRF